MQSDEDVKISNEHTPSNTPKTWKIEQRASILDIETKLLRVEEEAKQIKITDVSCQLTYYIDNKE